MAHKKNTKSGELTAEEMRGITIDTPQKPEADGGACDIRRPTDCD